MEQTAEVSGLKGVVFNQYDGTGSFQQWKEELTLVLLANDMWCFIEGTDPGDKKTSDQRKQRAFAIIALNLSRSCRDCLRGMDTKDPKEAWNAVLSRFEQTTPATKMVVLDALLNLRCGSSVLEYVSAFNGHVARLSSMDERLGKDLRVAMFLRGLPTRYSYLVSSIKVREKLPDTEEVVQLVLMEGHHERTSIGMEEAYTVESKVRCEHRHHDRSRCWKLHPELAPTCHRCKQKGHLQRYCPNQRGDAIESDVKHDTLDETHFADMGRYAGLYENLLPISL